MSDKMKSRTNLGTCNVLSPFKKSRRLIENLYQIFYASVLTNTSNANFTLILFAFGASTIRAHEKRSDAKAKIQSKVNQKKFQFSYYKFHNLGFPFIPKTPSIFYFLFLIN